MSVSNLRRQSEVCVISWDYNKKAARNQVGPSNWTQFSHYYEHPESTYTYYVICLHCWITTHVDIHLDTYIGNMA